MKNSPGNEVSFKARDSDLIPGLGRAPGVGNGTPLQDSCLESSMGRRAWWATVQGGSQSQTQLSTLYEYAFYQQDSKLLKRGKDNADY